MHTIDIMLEQHRVARAAEGQRDDCSRDNI
jgi:hypothetical protein